MNYCTSQLPDGRWGVFENDRLLATIASQNECRDLLRLLIGRKHLAVGNPSFPATVILPSQLKRNSLK